MPDVPPTGNTIDVSSYLTKGHAATIWFDLNSEPHVLWSVTATYRNGLDEKSILEAWSVTDR